MHNLVLQYRFNFNNQIRYQLVLPDHCINFGIISIKTKVIVWTMLVNNSGPKTDPRETTLITGHQLEEDSFKNTV